MAKRPAFLRALYDGSLETQARDWSASSIRDLAQAVAQREEVLLATLTPAQKALFEDYQKAETNFMAENEVETFLAGFRLGGHCIYEVFTDGSEPYYR